jgi:peroxiredoxin
LHREQAVKGFLNKLGVSLPVLTDEYEIIGKRYGLIALPSNFVIDREGILRAKYLGYSEEVKRDFERRLKELLAIW